MTAMPIQALGRGPAVLGAAQPSEVEGRQDCLDTIELPAVAGPTAHRDAEAELLLPAAGTGWGSR